jgi:prepilin-type N-terminal cleavage/methylation domain-containing protein
MSCERSATGRAPATLLDHDKQLVSMLQKLQTKHAGFTLVEIMIVAAIIAVLAAIAVPGIPASPQALVSIQDPE